MEQWNIEEIGAQNSHSEDEELGVENRGEPSPSKVCVTGDKSSNLHSDSSSSSLYPLRNDISADVICEFLEVAWQQILYHRGIYPKEIFNVCRKYHVNVHVCVYPELPQYVANVIKELKLLIYENKMKKVILSVLRKGEVIEKFVFEFAEALYWSQKRDAEHITDLEMSLRECLLKIVTFDSPPPEDPASCTFEISAHIDKSSAVELLYDDESPVKWVRDDTEIKAVTSKLHPLKTIKESPFMKMQLYVLTR